MSLSLTMIPGMLIWVGVGGGVGYEFGSFVHFVCMGVEAVRWEFGSFRRF